MVPELTRPSFLPASALSSAVLPAYKDEAVRVTGMRGCADMVPYPCSPLICSACVYVGVGRGSPGRHLPDPGAAKIAVAEPGFSASVISVSTGTISLCLPKGKAEGARDRRLVNRFGLASGLLPTFAAERLKPLTATCRDDACECEGTRPLRTYWL